MKKTIKLIKNNILGFIIGAVIFTGVGVSAATYLYSSNQISYSNSNSSVTDVKGAIDELYTNLDSDRSSIFLNLITNENRTATTKSVEFVPTRDCSQVIVGGRRYGGAFVANIVDSSGNTLTSTTISDTAAASGQNSASYITFDTVSVELKKGQTYYLSSQGQGTGYNLFSFLIYP